MLPVRRRTPRCDVRSRMRTVWRRRSPNGDVRRSSAATVSLDAMQHNNTRHRGESCGKTELDYLLDRCILKSRGLRSRLTSAARP
eukprot:6235639-Prymnesium_polylepis.2